MEGYPSSSRRGGRSCRGRNNYYQPCQSGPPPSNQAPTWSQPPNYVCCDEEHHEQGCGVGVGGGSRPGYGRAAAPPLPQPQYWLRSPPPLSASVADIATATALDSALKKLEVTLTHRRISPKFVVVGLTNEEAGKITFPMEDANNMGGAPRMMCLPCLKSLALAKPVDRKAKICDMVESDDGPCRGGIVESSNMGVNTAMTRVSSRVLNWPVLNVCDQRCVACKMITQENGNWNFQRNKVLEGSTISRWAIIDLYGRQPPMQLEPFINSLVQQCLRLGIRMSHTPLFKEALKIDVLNDTNEVSSLLYKVRDRAEGKLQILVCVMVDRHPGYNTLKRISENEVGIITQCCLRKPAAKPNNDQYLSNLALKMNAKLRGSTVTLFNNLPHIATDKAVMLTESDLNHPKSYDGSSHSITADVDTINWPEANKYASDGNRLTSTDYLRPIPGNIILANLYNGPGIPDGHSLQALRSRGESSRTSVVPSLSDTRPVGSMVPVPSVSQKDKGKGILIAEDPPLAANVFVPISTLTAENKDDEPLVTTSVDQVVPKLNSEGITHATRTEVSSTLSGGISLTPVLLNCSPAPSTCPLSENFHHLPETVDEEQKRKSRLAFAILGDLFHSIDAAKKSKSSSYPSDAGRSSP